MKEVWNQYHYACSRKIMWFLLFAKYTSFRIVYVFNSCWFEIYVCIINVLRFSFTIPLLFPIWIRILHELYKAIRENIYCTYLFQGNTIFMYVVVAHPCTLFLSGCVYNRKQDQFTLYGKIVSLTLKTIQQLRRCWLPTLFCQSVYN